MGTLAGFAADLAGRTDHQLLRLFSLRPDAIAPPVANFADLASRLSTTASIDAALDQLSLPELHALAAVARGADHGDWADWAELDSLHELALVLREDSASLPSQKYDAGTHRFLPLAAVGLALGSGDGVFVEGAGGHAGASGAGVGGAGVSGAGGNANPAGPFVDLLTVVIPRLTPVSPAMLENAVGSAVEALLRTMNALLDVVGNAGISALRGGSIGVRPVRELSKALDIEAESVHFFLELAAAAQLIIFDQTCRRWRAHDGPIQERPTAESTWRSLARPEQWFVLVQSWLSNVRPPAAQIRPLAPYDPPRHARQWRHQIAGVLSDLSKPAAGPAADSAADSVAAGSAAPSSAAPSSAAPSSATPSTAPSSSAAPDHRSLMDALAWQHPRQTATLGHELPLLLHEMEWLGITGAGALSSPGRAAVHRETALALTAMSSLLPAPVENFVLQGDLTAIAPGFLVPDVASTLKLLAVPEGRGAAGIFRFSQRSLETAAAGGMSRSATLDFLQQHSSTAVPQSLEFLIAEVFRNRPAGYLPAESAPQVSSFQLPAPSPSAQPTAASFPAASSPAVAQRRTAQLPEPGNGVVHDETDALAQLKLLRSQPVWANDGVGESGPALVIEQLRQALRNGSMLGVRAVDGAGEVEELLLRPVSLEAGMLRAILPATGRERRISIHRIISAVASVQANDAEHASTTTSSITTSRERHD